MKNITTLHSQKYSVNRRIFFRRYFTKIFHFHRDLSILPRKYSVKLLKGIKFPSSRMHAKQSVMHKLEWGYGRLKKMDAVFCRSVSKRILL